MKKIIVVFILSVSLVSLFLGHSNRQVIETKGVFHEMKGIGDLGPIPLPPITIKL